MYKDELKRENLSLSITLQTLAWRQASEESACFHTSASATIKTSKYLFFP